MPVILAGDFNVNVKDNYNAELVEFMKDTFDLDILSNFRKERYGLWTTCGQFILQELRFV
jgi:hypothetical protein